MHRYLVLGGTWAAPAEKLRKHPIFIRLPPDVKTSKQIKEFTFKQFSKLKKKNLGWDTGVRIPGDLKIDRIRKILTYIIPVIST